MKKNKGSGLVIGLGILAVVVTVGVFMFGTYVKYYNMGVGYEKRLEGVWKENKVVLNSYTTKVQEVAQVPDMFRDDLTKVIEKTFSGRYGEDGSKAVFQFIQEQNMTLDPQLYRQIQQVMESGRNDFQMSQKVLIDVKMNYQAQLNYFWSGMWLSFAGYPKLDLNKYNIITTDDVEAKFNSGKDSVIKLR